ncbi:MAG: FKBP-type peptidyl-prolyl cis-trans isomerase [Gemmatimonadales bacterium]|nr:FKBP-type peptidyl-prolyl cis-trans isomerase [Gemmatimonadales bacterium]
MRLLPLLLLAAAAACGEVRSGDALQSLRAPDPPELPVVPELIDYHPDLQIAIAEMQMKESGLLFQDDSVGVGDSVTVGSTVVVHYTGWFPDGTVFDTSRESGNPISFQVGRGEVIEAWEEGLLGMRVGGRRKLVVPPALGYGEGGWGSIPPNAVLVFEVELLELRP